MFISFCVVCLHYMVWSCFVSAVCVGVSPEASVITKVWKHLYTDKSNTCPGIGAIYWEEFIFFPTLFSLVNNSITSLNHYTNCSTFLLCCVQCCSCFAVLCFILFCCIVLCSAPYWYCAVFCVVFCVVWSFQLWCPWWWFVCSLVWYDLLWFSLSCGLS